MSSIGQQPSFFFYDEAHIPPKRADLRLKYLGSVDKIAETYLTTNKGFQIGNSGGKDSGVVTDLVIKALLQIKARDPKALTKTVHIINSDTGMEFAPVIEMINYQFDRIERFAKEHGLPIVIHRVKPEIRNSFYSLLLGKGYPLSTRQARWCTDRLKVKPQQSIMNKISDENENGYYAFVGTRAAESADRKKKLAVNTVDDFIKKHENPKNLIAAPIEDFTTQDVWDYLFEHAESWVDAPKLYESYILSTGENDQECRTMVEGSAGENPGCSGSGRFGCTFCSLLHDEDKAMSNMVKHFAYLLQVWVARHKVMRHISSNWEQLRDVQNHRLFQTKEYSYDNYRKGMTSPGGYMLSVRKKHLEWILRAEYNMRNGITDYSHIRRYIRDEMDHEKHKRLVVFLEETLNAFERVQREGNPYNLQFKKDMYLINDEELSYIAKLWIQEGDMDIYSREIAEKYDRKIVLDEEDITIALLGRKIRDGLNMLDMINGEHLLGHRVNDPIKKNIRHKFETYPDMFITQLSKQLFEHYEDEAVLLSKMSTSQMCTKGLFQVGALVGSLGVNLSQDYPSEKEEYLIRSEWQRDDVRFSKQLEMYNEGMFDRNEVEETLFGFNGERAQFFEKKQEFEIKGNDATLCEKFSLEEQIDMIENW